MKNTWLIILQKMIKLLSISVLPIAVVGCATAPSVNSMQTTMQNNSLPTEIRPPSGQAKVFFVGGRTGSTYGLKVSMAAGAVFLVNGNPVGQLEKNTTLEINVIPGSYSFAWRYPSADAKIEFLNAQINAGDVLILQADYIFQLFGPAEYKLARMQDPSLVMNKQRLKPMTCPESFCRQ